jgi:hypothetical protein
MFEGYKPSFIMPEIVGNLTVARFLGVYWVFIPPLGKFTRKRKYLANRFSQMKNLQNSTINKYSSAKIRTADE